MASVQCTEKVSRSKTLNMQHVAHSHLSGAEAICVTGRSQHRNTGVYNEEQGGRVDGAHCFSQCAHVRIHALATGALVVSATVWVTVQRSGHGGGE